MKRRLWTAAAAWAAVGGVHAVGLSVDWTVSRDFGLASDGGLMIVDDGLGNIVTIGATNLFVGGEDLIVIKYDSDGDELWSTTINGVVANSYDFPAAAVGDAGGVVIAAETTTADPAFSTEWWTLKLDGAGAISWERRHRGTGTFGEARPRALARGSLGEIAVVGWVRDDASFSDLGVVVYEADGTQRWSQQFSSPGFEADAGEAVAFTPAGGVVIAGQFNTGPERIIATVQYSASGTLEWSQTYDASMFFNLEDRIYGIATDAAGNVFVSADGVDTAAESRDFVVLKYDATGTLVWDRRLATGDADLAPQLLLGDDGQIFLSGQRGGAYRLAAYSPAGDFLWTAEHPGAVAPESTRDHAVVDQEGHVAVLLRTVPTPGIATFTLVRFAADGSVVDQATLDPAGVTRTPAGLARIGADALAATGWWAPNGHRDALTVRYRLPELILPGDMNCDGVVTVADVGPFVLALTAPSDYTAQFPDCRITAGDINDDGAVSVGDIGPFVALVTR